MAKIQVVIRTTKTEGYANLLFRVSDGRAKNFYIKTNIVVDIEQWDNKNERLRNKANGYTPQQKFEINNAIEALKKEVLSTYFANADKINNATDFDSYFNPKEEKPLSFFDVFELYLESKGGKENSAYKQFKHLEKALSRYQYFRSVINKKGFELSLGINPDDIKDFWDYIVNEHRLCAEYPKVFAVALERYPIVSDSKKKSPMPEQRGRNTIAKMLMRLRAFFNWAYKEGYTNNKPFENLPIEKEKYNSTPNWLSREEVETIYSFDLSANPRLERQRDVFIFQCYIGCRVSDLKALTRLNIVNDNLEYVPVKTSNTSQKTIKFPLHTIALKIIDKYKEDSCQPKLLPFISDQQYNNAIKEIFTLCGITRIVHITNSKTGKPEQRPLNEIASSHMARRTFVGRLNEADVKDSVIASMSGHVEDSKAFNRYRAVTDELKSNAIDKL